MQVRGVYKLKRSRRPCSSSFQARHSTTLLPSHLPCCCLLLAVLRLFLYLCGLDTAHNPPRWRRHTRYSSRRPKPDQCRRADQHVEAQSGGIDGEHRPSALLMKLQAIGISCQYSLGWLDEQQWQCPHPGSLKGLPPPRCSQDELTKKLSSPPFVFSFGHLFSVALP